MGPDRRKWSTRGHAPHLPSRVGQSSNKLWLHICMYIHVPNTFIVLLKVTSMYICRVHYIRLYQFVYLLTPVRAILVGRRISVTVFSIHMAQPFAYSIHYIFGSLSLSLFVVKSSACQLVFLVKHQSPSIKGPCWLCIGVAYRFVQGFLLRLRLYTWSSVFCMAKT